MVGFGNNNDEGQQSGGGFFSGIGSFLWKAIKIIAIAAAAVLTLGAVFSWSDKARVFVDGFTGGKDDGWGSKISQFYKDTKEGISNYFNPDKPVDQNSVVGKKSIKIIDIPGKERNVDFPRPLALLSDSEIVKEPDSFLELTKLQRLSSELKSSMMSQNGRADKIRMIGDKQKEIWSFGESGLIWNKAIDEFVTKNYDLIQDGKVADISSYKIPLQEKDFPKLPDTLENFGKKVMKKAWDTLPYIEKMKVLEKSFGTTLVESELGSKLKADRFGPDNHFPVGLAIKEFLAKGLTLGTASGQDTTKELIARSDIGNLIEQGRFKEAEKLADEMQKTFLEMGNKLSEGNDDKKLYRGTSEFFGKVSEYAAFLQRKEEFTDVSSKFNEVLVNAAKPTSTILSAYGKVITSAPPAALSQPSTNQPVDSPPPVQTPAPGGSTPAPEGTPGSNLDASPGGTPIGLPANGKAPDPMENAKKAVDEANPAPQNTVVIKGVPAADNSEALKKALEHDAPPDALGNLPPYKGLIHPILGLTINGKNR